ncbi:hypothetical protein M501DRAFT_56500 [Patellaria atrata CBS 101060]|uniref:Uncharacterized protein n=1 Tax=Patellaria atrata CBS 101060 TaxID=1346257 RepID=A0A9P4SK62_9PEZI|nr:hypothetical protein M501DRAFT_56500 [Patellaria atrata CBS 101060]
MKYKATDSRFSAMAGEKEASVPRIPSVLDTDSQRIPTTGIDLVLLTFFSAFLIINSLHAMQVHRIPSCVFRRFLGDALLIELNHHRHIHRGDTHSAVTTICTTRSEFGLRGMPLACMEQRKELRDSVKLLSVLRKALRQV